MLRNQIYDEGDELQAAEVARKSKHVEAFINFCVADERRTDPSNAWRTLTVAGFPQKYTWQTTGEWKLRQTTQFGLGRMYPVHPSKGDVFYLRTLLCSLTGEDVRDIVLDGDNVCRACLDRRPNTQIHPCNHQLLCSECTQRMLALGQGQCPICRGPIVSFTLRTADKLDVHQLKQGYATFKDVCLQRGLLADDGEWSAAMREAQETAMPEQLRALFMHILCTCQPCHPQTLFEEHCSAMGDDYRRLLDERQQGSDANVRACVLYTLRQSLDPETVESDRAALMMLPQLSAEEEQFVTRLGTADNSTLEHVYKYDAAEEQLSYLDKYELCCKIEAQKQLVDDTCSVVEQGGQLLTFIDAPGGCGKTFCFNTILARLRGRGKVVLAVAATGIAALQLVGGKTVHTALRIPLDPTGSRKGIFAVPITKNSALGRLIMNDIDLIVWDEAPMTHRDIFDSLDDTFKKLRNDSRPFGGISVMLGGDFRQCLPVIRGATRAQQTAASIRHSSVFQAFGVIHLTINVRVEHCKLRDPSRSQILNVWAESLLRIGDGENLSDGDESCPFESFLPDIVQRCSIGSLQDVHDMIHSVFGDLCELSKLDADELCAQEAMHSAVLCPLHVSVDFINRCCLAMWDGIAVVKHGSDSYENANDAMVVTLEQLNAQTPGGTPPQRLELKLGMPLVLLRNMAHGLMNGTRLLLLAIQQNVIKCRVLTGCKAGNDVYLPRFTFKHEGPDQPLVWIRRQFPVKPCWAFTITKSQGQTFSRVAVCLVQVEDDQTGGVVVEKADVFSHGQLYVALSRCGDHENVCVYVTNEQIEKGTIVNVVYTEALLSRERPAHPNQHAGTSDHHATSRMDVVEDDVMYDPRAHIQCSASPFRTHVDMEVPHHGYEFRQDDDPQWDGQLHSIDDDNLNEFDIDQLMNSEMFDQCEECLETLLNNE